MDFMKIATLFPVSHSYCCILCIINKLDTWGQLSLFVGMYHNKGIFEPYEGWQTVLTRH